MNRKNLNKWAMLLMVAVLTIMAQTACTSQNKSGNQTSEQTEVTQEEMEALAKALPKYSLVYSFHEGLAVVCDKKTDLWGFIDKLGNEVIPCQYEFIFSGFSEGVAIVDKDDARVIIDKEGNEIASFNDIYQQEFHEGLMAFIERNDGDEEKEGFMDKTGKVVIPATINVMLTECTNTDHFSEGLCRLCEYETGKSIFIDKKGNKVFECEGTAEDFSEGLASVGKSFEGDDGEWMWYHGFVDKTGSEVIPFIFQHVGCFSDGLCWAETDDQCGFINREGKFVLTGDYQTIVLNEGIECGEYPLCPSFSEGLAWVCNKDGKYGYIDKKGKVVIPFRYKPGYDEECEAYDQQPCYDFHGGIARIWDKKTGLFGFIDREGNKVVPCQFDTAEDMSEGLALVYRDDDFGFIDAKGNCTLDLDE